MFLFPRETDHKNILLKVVLTRLIPELLSPRPPSCPRAGAHRQLGGVPPPPRADERTATLGNKITGLPLLASFCLLDTADSVYF